MGKYDDLKEACYRSNMQLPAMGLVIYTFGNVSMADRNHGIFAIKPSGVPYSDMKPSDMVIVDFEGKTVEGKMNPSSDTQTHAFLFRSWPALAGISHTHSTYAVAWAQAEKDIPILGTTHADHLASDIPCCPPLNDEMIKGNYELETGKLIVNTFREKKLSPEDIEMVLVANHGPFTWGPTAEKAVYNSAILENLAKIALLTLQVNPSVPRLKESLIHKHYRRKHGDDAYYGQK